MGLIILIISFDPSNTINVLRGSPDKQIYNGFEPIWYNSVGQQLCSTIFLSAILTNVPELQNYAKTEVDRFLDRRFQTNLKKDVEDEIDDEPNSKCKLQEQLNALYLGPDWNGPRVISRMISTLLIICSYSSGMPVLYIIGFFFFSFSYAVNKLVIFKFYQKTLTVDRLLPI